MVVRRWLNDYFECCGWPAGIRKTICCSVKKKMDYWQIYGSHFDQIFHESLSKWTVHCEDYFTLSKHKRIHISFPVLAKVFADVVSGWQEMSCPWDFLQIKITHIHWNLSALSCGICSSVSKGYSWQSVFNLSLVCIYCVLFGSLKSRVCWIGLVQLNLTWHVI